LNIGGLKFSRIKGHFPPTCDAEKESLRKETCTSQMGMNAGKIHGCNSDLPTVRALLSARKLLKFISWEGDWIKNRELQSVRRRLHVRKAESRLRLIYSMIFHHSKKIFSVSANAQTGSRLISTLTMSPYRSAFSEFLSGHFRGRTRAFPELLDP